MATIASLAPNQIADQANLKQYFMVLETGDFISTDAIDVYIAANPGRTYQPVWREGNQGVITIQTPPNAITQADLDANYLTPAQAQLLITAGIDAVVNGAGTSTDTLSELAALIAANATVDAALTAAIGSKSNIGHGHNITDIALLQATLDAKALAIDHYTSTQVDAIIDALPQAAAKQITCFTFAEKSISKLDWVQIGTVTDSDTSFNYPWAGRIIAVSAYCEDADANNGNIAGIDLYLGDSNIGTILTLPENDDPHHRNDTSLNIAVTTNSRIRIRGSNVGGMKLSDCVINLFIEKD